MLQSINFHIILTFRPLSSILSASDLIYIKLIQDWLRMSLDLQHPLTSRAVTLVFPSLPLKGCIYSIQGCIQNLLCHIWHKMLIVI